MKIHLIEIEIHLIEIHLIEYNNNDKKVETEISIHSINDQTVLLDTNSNVFVDDIIKSFMNEYNNIDK